MWGRKKAWNGIKELKIEKYILATSEKFTMQINNPCDRPNRQRVTQGSRTRDLENDLFADIFADISIPVEMKHRLDAWQMNRIHRPFSDDE